MWSILKRNSKIDRDDILRKAIGDSKYPFKFSLAIVLLIESILIADFFIEKLYTIDTQMKYLFFYISMFIMSLVSILLLHIFSKNEENGYKYIRHLQTIDYVLMITWASAISCFDLEKGIFFGYITYCTMAVVIPLIFYINRYVQFVGLFITQIFLICYAYFVAGVTFSGDLSNFLIFCIFSDAASVGFGFTKMTSIKREITVNRLSNRDPLTELLNRHKLNMDSTKIMELNYNNKYELSCIMMDIDNFKSINDTVGHTTGDEVIRCVAKAIREEANRNNCFCYRYGGEEFLIIGNNMSRNQACNLVESIQKILKNTDINGYDKKITMSYGIYTKVPNKEDNIELYYSKADELLYVSKKNGKNQYTFNGREQNISVLEQR